MLKKLRKRFVRITMLSLMLVLFVQMIAVNAVNILQRDNNCKNILNIIVKQGELNISKPFDTGDYFWNFLNPFRVDREGEETPYATKYFVVTIKGDKIVKFNGKNIYDLSEEQTINYASKALNNGPGYGIVDRYRYYCVQQDDNSATIGFVNYERDVKETMKLAGITFIVGVLLIIMLVIPVMYFAKKAVQPVERTIEKQKQFITDASHELKTPIAIISANAEVLEMVQGETEWTTSIKNQTRRLSTLVKNLVTLSKLEETRNTPTIESFNLSDAVLDVAKTFETPAKAKNVEMIFDVQDNIIIRAAESEIRQLVSILCDNAVKYVTEGGQIKVSCKKRGRTINMEFFNDCDNIDSDKLSKLFDRFYRTDKSRNSGTGGHGIGLSIARVVVERNGGTISAVSTKKDSVTFKITF